MTINAVYLAKPEYITELRQELGGQTTLRQNLLLSSQRRTDVCFAQDIWLEPVIVPFQSISEAVKLLRQAGKFWYLHPLEHVRRSRLIEAQLRRLPPLAAPFSPDLVLPKTGVFTLLDNNTLLYSVNRQKQWPDGRCLFIEDKINPPNRAYLKLWEALFLLGRYPKPGDKALDLGASPGGWTYVMSSLGAQVTAVDKAALDPAIARRPGVQCLQQSAFALEPAKMMETYDWVLSDIACYPDRACNLIKQWIDSGKARQLIFTIKLQGAIDLNTLRPFQDIAGARVLNLFYNKHEVTFFYSA